MKRDDEKALKLGLPAGSLKDMTLALLKKAGYPFTISLRSYVPRSGDPEIAPRIYRAQEIPRYVADSHLDAGLTGEDMVVEAGAKVVELAKFRYARQGLGRVRWVVAVPVNSPMKSVRDLRGKRIATEVVNLTRTFLKANGVTAEVEFSWGATEAKVPELADAVVETTETGSSLAANGLRILAEIMTSDTVLIGNASAMKDKWKRAKAEEIACLMAGAIAAETMVGLKMNVPRSRLRSVLAILPAMKRPTISALSDPKWASVETVIEQSDVRRLVPRLREAGAQGLVEYPLNKVIP